MRTPPEGEGKDDEEDDEDGDGRRHTSDPEEARVEEERKEEEKKEQDLKAELLQQWAHPRSDALALLRALGAGSFVMAQQTAANGGTGQLFKNDK